MQSPPVYDVVVIGSGAGGGTMVNVLTRLGVNVALLEAGPMLNPAKDYKEHKWPYDYDHRGALDGGIYSTDPHKPFSFFSAPNGYWSIEDEPYTVAEGSNFTWFRSRILGGRTNHYGRITLRFADYDFKPYSTDGLGYDWPITYEEVVPYYEKAERFIGVSGTKEGIRSAPDGIFQPPAAPRVHEQQEENRAYRDGHDNHQVSAGTLHILELPAPLIVVTCGQSNLLSNLLLQLGDIASKIAIANVDADHNPALSHLALNL